MIFKVCWAVLREKQKCSVNTQISVSLLFAFMRISLQKILKDLDFEMNFSFSISLDIFLLVIAGYRFAGVIDICRLGFDSALKVFPSSRSLLLILAAFAPFSLLAPLSPLLALEI